MKNMIVAWLLISPMLMEAQQLKGTIKDPNYWGVKTYSNTEYSGTAQTYATDGQIFNGPFKSVKIYGPWRIVRIGAPISIQKDDPDYSGSTSSAWRVEKTNTVYAGIVYSKKNYSGEATYLKVGSYHLISAPFMGSESLPYVIRSLRLKVAAKVDLGGTSGIQKCYNGNVANLPKPGVRISINFKYSKCAGSAK